jgi:hypothetical protein
MGSSADALVCNGDDIFSETTWKSFDYPSAVYPTKPSYVLMYIILPNPIAPLSVRASQTFMGVGCIIRKLVII